MKLYLIQHGLALAKEEDPERPLSTQGKAETQRTAEYLKSRSIKVDAIWHSTKLRAVQTVEIIDEAIACGKIQAREDMNPLDTVEKFHEKILAANKDIMIIGHLPFLQKLADSLLTGSEESKIIAFKNSGVVSLDYDEKWTIGWLVSPENM
jgi:phosphohistidine phosphatase